MLRNQVNSLPGKYDSVVLPYKGGQYHAVATLPAEGVDLSEVLEALKAGPGGPPGQKVVSKGPEDP